MERADLVAESLEVVSRELTRCGIWHCLTYGTLLGAVRDSDVIPWDHDFDLFARPVDAPRILALNEVWRNAGLHVAALRYPGSFLAMNTGGVTWFDPMHLEWTLHGEPIGDAFMPSLFADGVLRVYDFATEVFWTPHFSIPHLFVQQLGTAKIRARDYPAVGFAEAFLAGMYGDDWRTPYRSVLDGGTPKADVTIHSHRFAPRLRDHIAWAEAQGWDRSIYRGLPQWPRRLAGAGPIGPTPRTVRTSRSLWWHDLEELARDF